MLSNAKYMLEKYAEHAEHILCTDLQYADYGQCIRRAILPIGVNDGGKKKRKEMAVPRAAGAYGRQLKMVQFHPVCFIITSMEEMSHLF